MLIGMGAVILGACTRAEVKQSRGNQQIESFSQAKKAIYRIFRDHARTLYCNCAYSKRRVDHKSCGFVPKRRTKRSQRTEIEHVVPAAAFGRSFSQWRKGHPDCRDNRGHAFHGRNCARKTSVLYRRMEADLYNLMPAIGEVNAERKHYAVGMIPGEQRVFGECDVEVKNRKVEPRPEIRGDIARIYFYMDWAYPGRGIVSKSRRRMLEAWDRSDPIDQWERTRNERIRKIQGNRNPFVSKSKEK